MMQDVPVCLDPVCHHKAMLSLLAHPRRPECNSRTYPTAVMSIGARPTCKVKGRLQASRSGRFGLQQRNCAIFLWPWLGALHWVVPVLLCSSDNMLCMASPMVVYVQAFAEAGADVLFIDALASEDEMRAFTSLGGFK